MPKNMAHNRQGREQNNAASPEVSAVKADVSGGRKQKPWSLSRIRASLYESCIHPLLTSRHTPSYDARSVSMGLVVGFVIPVGGQLVFLGFLRLLFSFNYVIAAGFTFVSNPLNMIPLYYGYYCLGSYLMGRPISLNFNCFEKIMHPVLDKSYFWDALKAFGELGSELLIPWTLAAVVLGVVFGIGGYIVTYGIQKKRCKKAAQRLGLQYEQYLARLRDRASQ